MLKMCSIMPKMCGMMPKTCGMMPKTCVMVPKMCSMVPKMCGMVPKMCGMVPKICGMLPKKRHGAENVRPSTPKIPQDPPFSNPQIPRPTDQRTMAYNRTNKRPNNTPYIEPLQIFNQGENLKSGVWQFTPSYWPRVWRRGSMGTSQCSAIIAVKWKFRTRSRFFFLQQKLWKCWIMCFCNLYFQDLTWFPPPLIFKEWLLKCNTSVDVTDRLNCLIQPYYLLN